MKNLQTKNSKPEYMIDLEFEKLLSTQIYDWDRFYDDMVPIHEEEDTMKMLYLLMVFEESLANRSDRMALYHALVKWAFTEKRLGKEDWISYKDTLDDDEYEEDEFNLDYIGAKPDKFIDELRAICNSRKEE